MLEALGVFSPSATGGGAGFLRAGELGQPGMSNLPGLQVAECSTRRAEIAHWFRRCVLSRNGGLLTQSEESVVPSFLPLLNTG